MVCLRYPWRVIFGILLVGIWFILLPTNATAAPDQSRLHNLTANLTNRAESAYWRLTNIANRLDSRLATTEPNPATTLAQETLGNAWAELTVVDTQLQKLDTLTYTFATAEQPALHWPQLKQQYETIKIELTRALASLRTAHQLTANPNSLNTFSILNATSSLITTTDLGTTTSSTTIDR